VRLSGNADQQVTVEDSPHLTGDGDAMMAVTSLD
jgi:hypothetical protein